jgi:hypothetical protein
MVPCCCAVQLGRAECVTHLRPARPRLAAGVFAGGPSGLRRMDRGCCDAVPVCALPRLDVDGVTGAGGGGGERARRD